MQRLVLWGQMVLCVAGCSAALPPHNYARELDPRTRAYVLGASDALRITVWRNPDLTTDATIRPDGTITMPLIGDLVAAGRGTKQLQAEITDRLSQYVVGATVTVAVAQVNAYQFTVAGEVARPGLFSSRNFVTVGEAIAMAGGPTRFADAENTRVVRQKGRRGIRLVPVDYVAVVSGAHPEQNIVVLPGDIVFVP